MTQVHPVPIGPFRGINNRLPDFALRTDAGDFVRSAINVDLDDSGRFRRRPGQTRIQALSVPHSLRQTADGRFFVVVGSVLYRITLPAYSQTLVKVLSSNARVYYAEHNGDLYYSNGQDCGRIAADNTWYPWALPTPAAPAVEAVAGTLPAGLYRVAVTYSNSVTGEEGGAKGATQFALSSAGALRVTLPWAVTGATHVNVYVSGINGGALFLYASLDVGVSSCDIMSLPIDTVTLQTEGMEPLPAGTGLFLHLGRIGAIVGGQVVYSEPWRMAYYRPVENWIAFEKPATIVVPAQNGCYIVADKTRWFAGDLANASAIVDVLPYEAIPGTEFAAVSDMTVGWFSTAGVVIATPDGSAAAVMADPIDLTAPASGASVVLISSGFERVISCGWALNLTTKAATQYSGFDYTSFAGGYGTKADGIYGLTGDTDNGTEVEASIGLGRINFGSMVAKRIPKIRLGVASEQPMVVTIATPGYPNGYSYEAKRSSSELIEQQAEPGKGLSASWFDIILSNNAGADFLLESASVVVAFPTRSKWYGL